MGNEPTKKKDNEITVEDEVQTTPPQDTNTSPYDALRNSLAADGKFLEDTINEKQQRIAEARKNRDEALKNKTSVTNTIFTEYKPKYDENKEKRLAKRAVAQSLGDLLSAVTSGYYAFRGGKKKGMGYVPTLPEGSHLKSLEEINRMKEEYRKANEAWKDFEIKQKLADEDAKVAAAQTLLSESESDLKTWEEKYNKYLQNVHNLNVKEAEAVAKSQSEDKAQQNRLAIEGVKHANAIALEGVKQAKDSLSKAEQTTLGYIEDFFGTDIYGTDVTTTTKPYEKKERGKGTGEYEDRTTTVEKSRKRSDLKKADLQSIIRSKSADMRFRVYQEFRKGGNTHEQAMANMEIYFAD